METTEGGTDDKAWVIDTKVDIHWFNKIAIYSHCKESHVRQLGQHSFLMACFVVGADRGPVAVELIWV